MQAMRNSGNMIPHSDTVDELMSQDFDHESEGPICSLPFISRPTYTSTLHLLYVCSMATSLPGVKPRERKPKDVCESIKVDSSSCVSILLALLT